MLVAIVTVSSVPLSVSTKGRNRLAPVPPGATFWLPSWRGAMEADPGAVSKPGGVQPDTRYIAIAREIDLAKFSAVALTVAGAATVILVGIASTATAATLQTFTSSSSTLSTDTSGPSITPSPSSDPNAITADIYVKLGSSDTDGPVEFQVTGVIVGDGPELTGADLFSNEAEYCGDVTVDVSLNPTTITVTGGESYCPFKKAYVEVTLNGVNFSSVTNNFDHLFIPYSEQNAASGLSGGSYMARGVHMGPSDPTPVLDSYGVSGSTFSAYWSGGSRGLLTGSAVFTWVPVALAAPAAAAAASFAG